MTTHTGPRTDPRGPDLQLYSLPECSVVPGGSPSGADSLTIFVAVRNGGPGPVDRTVPVTMTSDGGHRMSTSVGISTGSSSTALQVDLARSDYSRVVHVTVVADPGNQIVERDESNNKLVISVNVPPRPTSSRDVPCTTP